MHLARSQRAQKFRQLILAQERMVLYWRLWHGDHIQISGRVEPHYALGYCKAEHFIQPAAYFVSAMERTTRFNLALYRQHFGTANIRQW